MTEKTRKNTQLMKNLKRNLCFLLYVYVCFKMEIEHDLKHSKNQPLIICKGVSFKFVSFIISCLIVF